MFNHVYTEDKSRKYLNHATTFMGRIGAGS
jgi:hypothetical protein